MVIPSMAASYPGFHQKEILIALGSEYYYVDVQTSHYESASAYTQWSHIEKRTFANKLVERIEQAVIYNFQIDADPPWVAEIRTNPDFDLTGYMKVEQARLLDLSREEYLFPISAPPFYWSQGGYWAYGNRETPAGLYYHTSASIFGSVAPTDFSDINVVPEPEVRKTNNHLALLEYEREIADMFANSWCPFEEDHSICHYQQYASNGRTFSIGHHTFIKEEKAEFGSKADGSIRLGLGGWNVLTLIEHDPTLSPTKSSDLDRDSFYREKTLIQDVGIGLFRGKLYE